MRLACALLSVCLASTLEAGEHKLLRRLSAVTACAAQGFDLATTSYSIAHGAREANGFLADAQGRPRWGRLAAMKAANCGAAITLVALPVSDKLVLRVNFTVTGAYGFIGTRNLLQTR